MLQMDWRRPKLVNLVNENYGLQYKVPISILTQR